MIYDQNTRDAAGRAADWLEANPTKHITFALALDAYGNAVPFAAPEAACFCALGRLGYETGKGNPEALVSGDYRVLNQLLGSTECVAVHAANDKNTGLGTILTGVERGHPDGIAMLRRIQNGEPL